MSNIDLIIEERAADIGNFMVGRLLPFRQRRMVGPFIFIDHMGPAELAPGENLAVAAHPHIGLSTLTFLFEGTIMHRDSLGNAVEIKPGDVNWMTAGKGIAHSERTPERLQDTTKKLHGLQIWVALPKELENMNPEFIHLNDTELPTWKEGPLSYKLIAGEFREHRSPVPVYSPLYLVEIKTSEDRSIDLGGHLMEESAFYILEGSVRSEGHTFEPKQILVAKDGSICSFELTAGSTIYLFGGMPFPEERFIDWNFVSSDKNTISAARERWKNNEFENVPGEPDRVPLPEKRRF